MVRDAAAGKIKTDVRVPGRQHLGKGISAGEGCCPAAPQQGPGPAGSIFAESGLQKCHKA